LHKNQKELLKKLQEDKLDFGLEQDFWDSKGINLLI
jgi:hypothetical protein